MKNIIAILAFACGSAAAQTVPTITFDSVAEPLQLPNDVYFGEVTGVAVNSKGHVFVLSRGNTTGPAYAAARNLVPPASSSARSARTCTPGRSATRCASTRRTTSG